MTVPAPYWSDDTVTLLLGDARETLAAMPDGSVDCIVTSPPYFQEARRVLADDGTCWINIGDSYVASAPGIRRSSGLQGRAQGITSPTGLGDKTACGLPEKNLLMIPGRVALTLQDDGWLLRNDIIWSRPNAMPESATDRMSTRYEHLFLLARSRRYWFDLDAVREPHRAPSRRAGATAFAGRDSEHPRTGTGDYAGPNPLGRNPGDVWEIATRPTKGGSVGHFATFPIDLPLRCIKAGCKPGGTVLDPFSGSGTTGAAARQLGRRYVGIDLNPAYHDLAAERFSQGVIDFGTAS